MSGAAWAQSRQAFELVNQSGFVIVAVNISPASNERWGPDILGAEVLANGESSQVNFDPGEAECVWDLRITYEEGDAGDHRGVDLCETTTVTIGAQ